MQSASPGRGRRSRAWISSASIEARIAELEKPRFNQGTAT
jgi:hypothetical protein